MYHGFVATSCDHPSHPMDNIMTNSEEGESELIGRFKSGDKDAANELIGKYFERVSQAARRRLQQRRLRGSDSQDIAASVFESLWKKADNQHFSDNDLNDSDELWRLLCVMIRYKTADHIRKENADKRGGGQLRGESVFAKPDGEHVVGLEDQSDDALAPDEIASFKDQHREMMSMLDDEILHEVVTLRMENNKIVDIAAHFGKSERWVKRKLALIRDIWKQQVDQISGE